jgi:hypothetical protein
MYNTLPDYLRKQAIENLFSTKTFRDSWEVWRPAIIQILGNNITEDNIINLGDRLTEIFTLTGTAGRDQSELSGGGTAWESLVCWYINLCTIGTRTVALKKMSVVPQPIRDAITVNYGNFACNTESDITVLIFPNSPDYNQPVTSLNPITIGGIGVPVSIKNNINPQYLELLVSRDFRLFEIGIIQCKTNWNDNAQIPMLWDMIYSAGGFSGRNITLGRNGFGIQDCQRFTYAFVTVPSNKNTAFGPGNVSTKRVANLSGGNFWGRPTLRNVARNLKEIFNNNYISGFRNGIRADIRAAIPFLQTGDTLAYFRLSE